MRRCPNAVKRVRYCSTGYTVIRGQYFRWVSLRHGVEPWRKGTKRDLEILNSYPRWIGAIHPQELTP